MTVRQGWPPFAAWQRCNQNFAPEQRPAARRMAAITSGMVIEFEKVAAKMLEAFMPVMAKLGDTINEVARAIGNLNLTIGQDAPPTPRSMRRSPRRRRR